MVKKGELTTLKKGLYITGPKINIAKPEPFLIANHLRGPSYVSLEAALSYWGLIPERVYEISSMTIKTSKNIQTSGILLRSQHQTWEYLVNDLRIDEEMLSDLDLEAIRSWIEDAPKKGSLSMLVKTISEL